MWAARYRPWPTSRYVSPDRCSTSVGTRIAGRTCRISGLDANRQPRDLLSELLRSVRLTGERVVAYGPLRTFSVDVAGTGTLHLVDEGAVVLRIDVVRHVQHAGQGDVILLPRGDPHHISDAGEQAHATVRADVPKNDV